MARFNSPFQDPAGNSRAPLIAWNMRMVWPGQSSVVGLYTGKREVIGRGPGHFAGFCTWFPRGREGLAQLEDLFYRLQGGIHHTRMYLPVSRYGKQSTAPTGTLELTEITGVAVNAANGEMSLTYTTAGLTSTITAGDHINVNNRLYKVHRFTQTGTGAGPYTIVVSPNAQPDVGDFIDRGQPFVDVRAAQDGQGDILSEGWINRPVVLDWVEAI